MAEIIIKNADTRGPENRDGILRIQKIPAGFHFYFTDQCYIADLVTNRESLVNLKDELTKFLEEHPEDLFVLEEKPTIVIKAKVNNLRNDLPLFKSIEKMCPDWTTGRITLSEILPGVFTEIQFKRCSKDTSAIVIDADDWLQKIFLHIPDEYREHFTPIFGVLDKHIQDLLKELTTFNKLNGIESGLGDEIERALIMVNDQLYQQKLRLAHAGLATTIDVLNHLLGLAPCYKPTRY